MKRATLYARVSKDDRSNDGRNLQGQLDMGRERCTEKGYRIVAELPEDDRGASGADFDLPQLNKALELARAGEFDVLVVRELDRFARGLAKQLIVEDEFKRAGVEVEYILSKYPDTPEGNLQKNIGAVVAEYERLKINQRMTRGRRLKVKAGHVVSHGNPKYGYRLAEIDGKRAFVVHEPEAKIIRLIFEWCINGKSSTQIAEELTEMGIPTWADTHRPAIRKNGKPGQWYSSTILKILHDETYIGRWHYGQRNNRTNKNNPPEHWITVEVPALVDLATWQAAQEQLKKNQTQARRNTRHAYLLRGRVTCGQCGISMRGCLKISCGREYKYYLCNSRKGHTAHGRCGIPSFRVDQVDAAVWEWLRELLNDPERLAKGYEDYEAEQDRENEPIWTRLGVVDSLIADNRGQLARLLDLFLAGDFPREMLIERKTRLEATIGTLEKERAALTAKLEAQALTAAQILSIKEFVAGIGENLESLSFETQRQLIEVLDVRATLAVEDRQKVVYARCALPGEETTLSIVHTTTRS